MDSFLRPCSNTNLGRGYLPHDWSRQLGKGCISHALHFMALWGHPANESSMVLLKLIPMPNSDTHCVLAIPSMGMDMYGVQDLQAGTKKEGAG